MGVSGIRVKRGPLGYVIKFEVRLVPKGFTQTEGVDYEETYAPVARFTSMRCLLALVAAAYEWEGHKMDVKTAFLHGELHEEIFMLPREGHKGKDVRKLKMSLYGLKQASRNWYEKIDTFFMANGFMHDRRC